MKARWEVQDGYVGKSRPQTTEIDDGDLGDCETEAEAEELILAEVDDDFAQKITPGIDNLSELLDHWRELRKP